MVRHKNRYIVVNIIPEEPLNFKLKSELLHHVVMNKIEELHGGFGAAATCSGFGTKYCNETTRIVIISARRGPHRLVTSCLPLIKYIDNKGVMLKSLYMGATIKQCYKFIKEYQQKKFDKLCMGLQTKEEVESLKKAIFNFDTSLSY